MSTKNQPDITQLQSRVEAAETEFNAAREALALAQHASADGHDLAANLIKERYDHVLPKEDAQ